jgi:hypothetical protein
MPRGGRRARSGRPTYFPNKRGAKQFSVVLTDLAFRILETRRKPLRASRSDFAQALVLQHRTYTRQTSNGSTRGPASHPAVLLFTSAGLTAIDALCRRNRVTRSFIVDELLRVHGPRLTASHLATLLHE